MRGPGGLPFTARTLRLPATGRAARPTGRAARPAPQTPPPRPGPYATPPPHKLPHGCAPGPGLPLRPDASPPHPLPRSLASSHTTRPHQAARPLPPDPAAPAPVTVALRRCLASQGFGRRPFARTPATRRPLLRSTVPRPSSCRTIRPASRSVSLGRAPSPRIYALASARSSSSGSAARKRPLLPHKAGYAECPSGARRPQTPAKRH